MRFCVNKSIGTTTDFENTKRDSVNFAVAMPNVAAVVAVAVLKVPAVLVGITVNH